jgi:hypothetical protein
MRLQYSRLWVLRAKYETRNTKLESQKWKTLPKAKKWIRNQKNEKFAIEAGLNATEVDLTNSEGPKAAYS